MTPKKAATEHKTVVITQLQCQREVVFLGSGAIVMKYGLILVRAGPRLLKTIVLFSVQQFKRPSACFFTHHLF